MQFRQNVLKRKSILRERIISDCYIVTTAKILITYKANIANKLKKSIRLGMILWEIVQETEILTYSQIVYAQNRIRSREWDA